MIGSEDHQSEPDSIKPKCGSDDSFSSLHFFDLNSVNSVKNPEPQPTACSQKQTSCRKRKATPEENSTSTGQEITRISRHLADTFCRQLPYMAQNVANRGFDLNFFTGFLHQYTHEQTKYTWRFMNKQNPLREVQRICFYGKNQIFLYFFIFNLFAPDVVWRISEEPVITNPHYDSSLSSWSSASSLPPFHRDNGRREIFCKIEASLSRMFETNPAEAGSFVNKILHHPTLIEERQPKASFQVPQVQSEDGMRCDSSNLSLDEDVQRLEDMFRNNFKVSLTPNKILLTGKVLFIINNIYESQEIDEIILETSCW